MDGTELQLKSSQDERSMTPLLLAAAKGHSEVLKSIVNFYDNIVKDKNKPFCVCADDRKNNDSIVNNYPFNVCTHDTKENILHLILKRPFLKVRRGFVYGS